MIPAGRLIFLLAALLTAATQAADPELVRSALLGPRVTIGVLYTATGPWALYGPEWRCTIDLYLKNLYLKGGIPINGTRHAVDFLLVDIGAQTTAGMVTNIQAAVAGPLSSVDFLIGPFSSGLNEAALKVVNSSKIFLAPGASADPIFRCDGSVCPVGTRRFSNAFSTSMGAYQLFDPVVNLAAMHGAKTFAYFYEDASYTQSACTGVNDQISLRGLSFTKAGGDRITAINSLNLTTSSRQQLLDLISSYRKSKPDFIVGCTYEFACESMINLMREVDFVPKGIAFSACLNSDTFKSAVGLGGRYITAPVLWHRRLNGATYMEDDTHPVGFFNRAGVPAPEEFYRQYKYECGVEPNLSPIIMSSLYALHTAFVRAGTVNPSAILVRMNTLMLSSSFYGPIVFDPFGRLTIPAATAQYDLNNDLRIVAPLAAANSRFIYPFPSFSQRACLESKQCEPNGECQANGQCLCPQGWTGANCETQLIEVRTLLEKNRCRGLYAACLALLIMWLLFIAMASVCCACWGRAKGSLQQFTASRGQTFSTDPNYQAVSHIEQTEEVPEPKREIVEAE